MDFTCKHYTEAWPWAQKHFALSHGILPFTVPIQHGFAFPLDVSVSTGPFF